MPHGGVPAADYRMSRLSTDRHGVRFDVDAHGSSLGTFTLPLPGRHNAMNALGALAAALELGAEVEAVREALARFGGVARRFERRGERDGVAFVDDYAHLPTEVEAAVAAAQSGGWGRVVAVFQPHRYSRTAALWRDFADSFAGADQLVLTGIYPAGELPQPGITGELVMRAVLDSHPWATVAYLPNRADLAQYLRAALRPGDLCLTLGAGDLTTLPDELLNA
ncbi:MAG TPA: hypothetical protein DEP69_06720 [Acidimicrobiaceae bacterium]|nr:hypothetical protein [Acidimicrobiaceae bacterium]